MKIIISGTTVLLVLFASYKLIVRGRLVVEPSQKQVDITINKKEYKSKDTFETALPVGKYTVKVSKEGFDSVSKEVYIGFNTTKKLKVDLGQSVEDKAKKSILEASNKFIETWYSYESQTDENYLAKIKPLITQEYYDETIYLVKNRAKDFENQSPLETKPLSSLLEIYNSTEAVVLAEKESTNKKSGLKTVKKVSLRLEKVNDKWLIGYSKIVR